MNNYRLNKVVRFAIFFLIILFKISLEGYCQLIQNQSIEFDMPVGASRPDYTIIPLKNGGFILQERNDIMYGKKEIIWSTKKYSNNMELVWKNDIVIPNDADFSMDCLTKDALFQNFTQSNTTKIKLLKINIENGEVEWIEGDLIGIQDILQMKIVGNSAFFSGRFQGRAVVMGLSFFDKTVKVLNGLYANHMEVVEIEADENENQLFIYTKNRYKGQCQMQLRTYSDEGLPMAVTNLENDSKKIPFNGRLNKLNDNESLMIGNYARYCDNFSQGIYIKKINENAVTKSKYIDFSEFKNFFNYLNPKRQKKVKEKLSKRKEAGKAVKFNYSMLVHKLYEFNNQLIIVAEIFYTEAKTASSMPYYMNGRDYTPYNYRFTHTIICGFDKEGNKLWDNCLPMKALSSNYLQEQVQLTQVGNNFILAYPEDGKIKTQVIEEDKTIREKEEFEVVAKKISFWDEDSNGGLYAWYDQNFLFWGYKTMPDSTNPNGRKVFFVNKLTYNL
jgi:hypothetical protein